MKLSFNVDIQITSNTNLINKGKEAASFLKERVSSAASRVIQFIQEKRPVVAKALRSATLEVAAFLGISRIVKALLASGPISQRAQSSALGWSGFWGHEKVMKAFLDTGAPLLKEDREKAIKNMAMLTSSLEVLSVLLNVDPKEISQKTREDAIKNAASSHDCPQILNVLLASGDISEKAKEEAIKKAARKTHLNMVNGLLVVGAPISEKAREEIILDIIKNARQEYGSRLFNVAFYDNFVASYGNFVAILKALLANGPISDETRKIAIQKAAFQRLFNVVEALFTPGLFSQQELEKIFEKTFDDLISVIKDRFAPNRYEDFYRLKETIDFILNKGNFSEETKQTVDCCYGIWAGDIKKLAFYLGSGTIFSRANRNKIDMALSGLQRKDEDLPVCLPLCLDYPTLIAIKHIVDKLPYPA